MDTWRCAACLACLQLMLAGCRTYSGTQVATKDSELAALTVQQLVRNLETANRSSPLGERWFQRNEREYLRRRSSLSDDDLAWLTAHVYGDIDWKSLIAGPSRWPAGLPIRFEFRLVRQFLPNQLEPVLVQEYSQAPCEACVDSLDYALRDPQDTAKCMTQLTSVTHFPPPPSGTTSIQFWVALEHPDRTRYVWWVPIAWPIEIVPAVTDAITPVADEATTRCIRQQLPVRLRWQGNEPMHLSSEPTLVNCDVACGLEVTFLFGDKEIFVERGVWSNTTVKFHSPPTISHDRPVDREAVERANPADPRWRVRVRGVPELAVYDFRHTRFWSGEFTMPLSEFITE